MSKPMNNEYVPGQFCWVDLASHNLDEAGEFYEDLLGWSRQRYTPTQGYSHYERFMSKDRLVAGISQMAAEMISSGTAPTWNSYIIVEDIERAVQRAEKLGATITVPPLDVGQLGRSALIQDPTGAVLGLWQKGIDAEAEQTVKAGSVFWNELQTRDAQVARQFYAGLFDWEFEDRTSEVVSYSLIRCGGELNGSVVEMDERWGTMPSRWAVYFTVESTDFTVDQVRQLGGMVYVPPFDYPLGRTAMVSDIQGAMFHLVEVSDKSAPDDEHR
jgi:predicted enzyme related to lactoylglutathione lyase